MSRQVNNTLAPLANNKAASDVLFAYLSGLKHEYTESLHQFAVSALLSPELTQQAQVKLGRLQAVEDILFDLEKSKS